MVCDALQVVRLSLRVLPGHLLHQVNVGRLLTCPDLCRAGSSVLRLLSGADRIVVRLHACLVT